MPIAIRERTIPASLSSGTVLYYGTLYSRTYSRGGYAYCKDTTGAGGNNPFYVYKIISKSGGTLSYASKDGSYRAVNWCATACVADNALLSFASTAALGQISDGQAASKILAQTNPSRPDVDIPVFIAEIKDLPKLVYDAGGGLIRMMARHHLRTHFGTLPLMRDLLTMLNFVALTEKRMAELKQLEKNGLSRTRELGRYSKTVQGFTDINSDRGWVELRCPTTSTTTSRVWGHVKWHPSPGFPATNADKLALARRAVLGLTVDASTAWELIPFSWLFDWFGSVGTYLAAKRNIVPCFNSQPLIMCETKSTTKVDLKVGTSYQIQGVTKRRTPTTATPFAGSLPFLSGRQLAVLGSLTILTVGSYSKRPKTWKLSRR